MTQKAAFSDKEWVQVKEAPALAGIAVTALDFGLISSVKEATAMIKIMVGAKDKYPQNELIQTICSESANNENDVQAPSNEGFSTEVGLRTIGDATAIVDRVATPQERKEYRELIYAVAEGAANAAGGGFFGGGNKVSNEEAAYLTRLKGQLGL